MKRTAQPADHDETLYQDEAKAEQWATDYGELEVGMTRDEITKLAKKAGIAKYTTGYTAWESQLEKFADLVAAAEREACAVMLDERASRYTKDDIVGHIIAGCADAIRARGRK